MHKLTEEGRNSVRQVRRDANERLKKLLKDHKISEDDEKKGLDEVQKITDQHIKQIDELQKKKDAGAARQVIASDLNRRQIPVSMSFFTHLECSVPCGRRTLDPRGRHHLCVLRRARCSPATISTRRARGRATASTAASRTCGGIAS